MAEENVVSEGSVVHVDYVGTLDDGSLFDTSLKEEAEKANLPTEERTFEPLKVEVGKHQVIPGFEEGLKGMKEGEEKEVKIAPENAYGEPNPQALQKVPRKMFENAPVELKEGVMLLLKTPQGPMPVKILEVGDEEVTLDANHPLAGKTLSFKLFVRKCRVPKLVNISSPL